jgi:hypothetical protein
MDIHDASPFAAATRHDGWSPALKCRFLSILAEKGNVRAAAARCARSAQSAYVQRRRDPAFAQAWIGALVLAQENGEQVLADRALDGVEEPIFYRGELVGTRRRYDNRLLLAHLERLDRLILVAEAQQAAGRFDELLAIVAGEPVPEALAEGGDGLLPPQREEFVRIAGEEAELAAEAASEQPGPPLDPDDYDRWEEAITGAGAAARAKAQAEWDGWFARACARVDALSDERPCVTALRHGPDAAAGAPQRRPEAAESSAWTPSIVSTSVLRPAVADGGDQGDAAVGIAERGDAGDAGGLHRIGEAGEPAFADAVERE